MGINTKVKTGKTKCSHRVLNTNITAGKVQQMEETGHPPINPPIKIKLKRLTSSVRQSQTVSQPESSGILPQHPAPPLPARHNLAEVSTHPNHREHTVDSQVVEEMLVDQPCLPRPSTLLPNENCWETWIQTLGTPVVSITHSI